MIAKGKLWRLAPAAAALAALALVASAAASVQKPHAESASTFKVGLLVPLTGALAQTGGWIRTAAEYGISEINKKGGVRGAKASLVVVDDAADPTQDVAGVTKLINQDHVNFILGPITSDGMLAVTP